ncbi:hypothetical protein AB1282_03510 [Gottfriedia sp. S16(2024)]|uniref:hypothetical protein n=1 Tax=Gottfriedia sp. S16(2024) TaxID=3162883 RepID=UPI003D203480
MNNQNMLLKPFLSKETIEKRRIYLFTKRLVDLSGAFLGLILLLPVHMIIAIILKLEDPKGPIFFF